MTRNLSPIIIFYSEIASDFMIDYAIKWNGITQKDAQRSSICKSDKASTEASNVIC